MTMSATGYEKKDINLTKVIIVGLLIVLFIVVSLIVLNEYFTAEKESMIEEVVLKPESVSLKELREVEDEHLTSYGFSDSTRTAYHIPIDIAMEIMAAEGRKLK